MHSFYVAKEFRSLTSNAFKSLSPTHIGYLFVRIAVAHMQLNLVLWLHLAEYLGQSDGAIIIIIIVHNNKRHMT